jgi:hypothetical protein
MPSAPEPVTSAPPVPGQPYDATAPGTDDTAPGPEHTYDGNTIGGKDGGWVKIRDAGKADMATGALTGGWPGDGTSDGRAWKQC